MNLLMKSNVVILSELLQYSSVPKKIRINYELRKKNFSKHTLVAPWAFCQLYQSQERQVLYTF